MLPIKSWKTINLWEVKICLKQPIVQNRDLDERLLEASSSSQFMHNEARRWNQSIKVVHGLQPWFLHLRKRYQDYLMNFGVHHVSTFPLKEKLITQQLFLPVRLDGPPNQTLTWWKSWGTIFMVPSNCSYCWVINPTHSGYKNQPHIRNCSSRTDTDTTANIEWAMISSKLRVELKHSDLWMWITNCFALKHFTRFHSRRAYGLPYKTLGHWFFLSPKLGPLLVLYIGSRPKCFCNEFQYEFTY